MRNMKKLVMLLVLALVLMPAAPALAHVAFCVETVNPHGQTVPPAGSSTLPGPKGGQNEDGFYEIGTNLGTPVLVIDKGADNICGTDDDTEFGPFPSGTKIKYTEANGATPNMKSIGSTNGQAGAIAWHIFGNGDFCVCPVFDSNGCVECLVPPPPK